MSDKRRVRRDKQVRRDARRAKKRNRGSSTDTMLTDSGRRALARGRPHDVLSIASLLLNVAKPVTGRDQTYLDSALAGLIGARNRETTMLLAVVAELLIDDPAAQLRCRQEVANRNEHLPRWIAALPQVDVYRAVRITDVLGDADELVLGARLDGRHELTVAVLIDHNAVSGIADVGVVPDPIDAALARAAGTRTDTDLVEMSLTDARVWIEDALARPTLSPATDAWPLYRALVQWLVGRLPEGGEHRSAAWEWEGIEELCDKFFATDSASPFTDSWHRELLLELIEDDRDPLRWSARRVDLAMRYPSCDDYRISLEVALDAPDLLRAFIPFAHAQSGIRDELTSRALAVIDALRSGYKREVLRRAHWWDVDDAV